MPIGLPNVQYLVHPVSGLATITLNKDATVGPRIKVDATLSDVHVSLSDVQVLLQIHLSLLSSARYCAHPCCGHMLFSVWSIVKHCSRIDKCCGIT
jgi:hypothetical protein